MNMMCFFAARSEFLKFFAAASVFASWVCNFCAGAARGKHDESSIQCIYLHIALTTSSLLPHHVVKSSSSECYIHRSLFARPRGLIYSSRS